MPQGILTTGEVLKLAFFGPVQNTMFIFFGGDEGGSSSFSHCNFDKSHTIIGQNRLGRGNTVKLDQVETTGQPPRAGVI